MPRLLFGTVFLFTISYSYAAQDNPYCQQSFAEHLNFAEIEDKVRKCSLGSIDQILSYLTARQRNHYVLVHTSRSLQGASFENPRAILHDGVGRFFMAFNGDPSQKGYNSLETIEFNEKTYKYEFRSIDFDLKGTAHISSLNPPKCMNCHGERLRPIWDEYVFWPGVFGSEDDDERGGVRAEKEIRQTFIENRDKHPRYKLLGNQLKDQIRGRPNELMGFAVHRGNYLALGHDIATNSKFDRFHYAILGSLLCSTDSSYRPYLKPNDFIPEQISKSFRRSYADHLNYSSKMYGEYFKKLFARQRTIFPTLEVPNDWNLAHIYKIVEAGNGLPPFSDSIANLFYLLENLSPGFMEGYSLPFDKVLKFGLFDGLTGEQDVGKALIETAGLSTYEWMKDVGRLNISYEEYRYGLYAFPLFRNHKQSEICLQLKEASLKALSN